MVYGFPRPMRIAIHDFGGYDFPTELSRSLARRGHAVLHLYCGDVAARGALDPRADDDPGLRIEAVSLGHPFEKYALHDRALDEVAYGRAAARRIRSFDPRAVLSANSPLLSQGQLLAEARRRRRRFIYWWQDSYGVGMREVIRRRRPLLAPVAAWPFEAAERRMLRRSDHVVAISEGLGELAQRWGVDSNHIDVVANWSPLAPPVAESARDAWRAAHRLSDRPIALYAGTLGLKHDPELLVSLALALAGTPARLVVVSQGPGRRQLEQRRLALGLANLVLLDYQPHAEVGAMLAAADVLVAILEPGAAAFSVPSKVFAYLAAGRPVVASIPLANQAATVIGEAGAGVCVAPGDTDAFVAAVTGLLRAPDRREVLGRRGRAFAVAHFAAEPITDRFERLLVGPRGGGHGRPAIAVGAATVGRIWSHPENAGRRLRVLATYAAWQVAERTVGRPWTVPLTPTRRIRCHPHSPLASSVLYYGLPDPMEMRFLLRFLAAGDVFVDVGAHLGLYTVLASSVPGVHVVALEPSTESFALLGENLELNGIGAEVTAVAAAAGSRPGRATLSTGADAMNGLVDGGRPGEEVEVTTVDHLVADLGLPGVAAIKIDVEGAELDVLRGAAQVLRHRRPVLIVEVNDPEGIDAFARAEGYTCVRYDPRDHTLTPAPVSSFDGRNALLVADLDGADRRLHDRGPRE